MNGSALAPGQRSTYVAPAGQDARVTEAQLLMSPPEEGCDLLSLHKWLYATAKGRTKRISRTREGDTVHRVIFERPIPFQRMLAALPYVADVMAEQPSDADRSSKSKQTVAEFRLVFKNISNDGEDHKSDHLFNQISEAVRPHAASFAPSYAG